MKGLSVFLAALLCVLLVLGVMLSCALGVCFDRDYYANTFRQTGAAESAGVTDVALDRVIHRVLDYLQGEAYSLDMQEVVDGQTREVFTQREKDHMVDVRGLTQFAFGAQIFCWTGVALLLLALVILRRHKTVGLLCRTYLWVFAGFAAVFGCLGAWAVMDFSAFWTTFHQIAFTNDLWILPADSFLIRMFPLEFFSAMVSAILLRILAILVAGLLLAGAGVWMGKRRKKKKWQYALQSDAAHFPHAAQLALAEGNSALLPEAPDQPSQTPEEQRQ